jgi:uracil-DNA glycosylase family 4
MEWGSEPFSSAAAASALQWWTDAGVDCLVDEEPRDWLRPKSRIAPDALPEVAEQSLPGQLELFRTHLAESDRLSFATPSAPRVLPSGDPAAGLMMLTDMPAAVDLRSGILLSEEAGRLFDRMLAAIGRSRDSIYLASLSCFRSPSGNFDSGNASACADLARHHIGLVAPQAVLLLGDTAAKALLGGLAVLQARGRWHQISTPSGQYPAMATFHPDRLLDQPAFKAAAWTDLQMLMVGPQ